MKDKKCKNCIACNLFCLENKNMENLKKIARREKYKAYKYGKHRRDRK